MRTRVIRLVVALAAIAVLAVGASAIATAKGPRHPAKAHAVTHQSKSVSAKASHRSVASAKASKETGETAGATEEATVESDSDAGAQAAACAKAGIDPNASNVNYDDQSGTCSVDNGGNG